MTEIDGVNETIDLEALEAEAVRMGGPSGNAVRIEGGPDEVGIEFTIDEDNGDLEIRCFAITSRPTEDIEIVSTFNVLNVRDPQAVIDALSNTH
ncbi:hypothetical protein [Curtobacterium sp. MCSS17_015]|uniref:hypothetical protein n=1 Tax=Curtobacterium sp. MCSS17_015 TaxID=2175666 RepID=UPI0011B3EB97|nr:hypothetical protein [Curtobacterium sp. MCSS17_015]WIB25830.1 hypothetical protein DEJ18_12340 [Curtobacterium sp. MCSS17_015]